MVGHFDIPHPCLFLFINQLHHKILIMSGLIVGSQQLPYTRALQCDCPLRLRSVTTLNLSSIFPTSRTWHSFYCSNFSLHGIQEIFQQQVSCASRTEIKLQVLLCLIQCLVQYNEWGGPGADTGGGGGGVKGGSWPPPLQKFLVYQDRDTLIEQSL